MTEKRFRKGKSILTDFPTGAIIDEETGERYYDGIKPSYISSKELVKILNELHEKNRTLLQKNGAMEEEIECLSEENGQLKQLLDYADDLIQSYMSVHNRDEWENVKKNITGDVE